MSFRHLFDSFSIGMLGTFILPFRVGELIRAWTLNRSQGIPFAVGFASIVAERVFDIIALLFLFGICLLRIENAPPEVTSGAVVLGIIATTILVVYDPLLFFRRRHAFVRRKCTSLYPSRGAVRNCTILSCRLPLV